ncbi:molecular chaperone HtpG [Tenacibaculum finnmarkense genomovar finnmarkense]|uniref:molecular chaperone HtpG n=1 Tax=Tenacibaculum finnmarkense TaxID=2781243 RepID=UPI001E3B70FC|nr:molecular chaperone HtpG [Tenacibaculum finnmarkense]MCD8417696.1 molecular chaperone HtpG [Tenacibaculum finnmarkense genomovar finnmarkense]MCG8186055.1 molecular chaperone HtpG [Tenacibaculum finnmarkense genomovar finnmarkense]MCG8202607.1 molecular chaperone HtpG [Tenacibaculum finnmarkense genomovar finnmarkense]MCG8210002.1 molecular chaperone HtpG [Tenacibaculum finnmarkense genomovar finnmarkense]MCG8212835.1 molecular chaperone HtpG [Tenacibaculum finnmarkense genomovar finnmarken
MSKGSINVSVENIFPLIKKFLYSDHEIFLRELISNGTDATTKLKHLISIGEAKTELGDAKIEISIDKDAKTITIKDQGLGMTADEVEKYINQIAFSGAEEFLEKYKDDKNETGVIGHFGLGFYSAFMVAHKVDLITKSFKDEPAAHWSCDGSPEYSLVAHDKADRGTEIILHVAEDSLDFLEEAKIGGLLNKYNRFNQVPIKFGTNKINDPEFTPATTTDADGKETTEPHQQIEVDNIINNTNPAWTKAPADLSDEDYTNFYRELYPTQFEESLFHIHLNVDYPFNLTGILFFPKLTQSLDMQKDKIQLYQNQVYVTDNVEGIVPDFLQMLKGVIDSPDIPLNVSRSGLQADGAVKKISGYITKKVGDKLSSLFKKDRADFEQKWNDIKVIIEYGMLSEDKFMDKAKKFALYPTVADTYFTFDELVEKTKDNQTDKDGNHIVLYTSNKEAQHSYIQEASAKGYEVVVLDSPIIAHLMQKLETSEDTKVQFVRVDSDFIDNLIKKDDAVISKLTDEEVATLKPVIEGVIASQTYTVQLEAMDSSSSPFIITVPEFMRRMKEMQASGGGGGMMGMGNLPEMYNLVVNTNSPLVSEILNADETKKAGLITQAFDLAKLSQNLLHGEALTNFIKRSYELIK